MIAIKSQRLVSTEWTGWVSATSDGTGAIAETRASIAGTINLKDPFATSRQKLSVSVTDAKFEITRGESRRNAPRIP